jgi:DNA-binding transcriptional LysR family regulator
MAVRPAHFCRAAARLHLSQPGLSYRVKALEDVLGYQVLARNRRGVRLTPAGEALLAGARRSLGQAHQVVDDGRRVARGERRFASDSSGRR